MLQILLILSLLACVLLVAIVLVQNPKGGGLASNFSASSQLMGVQKTGDFLEKGTWGLAIFIMVMALAINIAAKGGSASSTTTQSDANASKVKVQTQPTTPFNPSAAPAQSGQKQQTLPLPSKPATGQQKGK